MAVFKLINLYTTARLALCLQPSAERLMLPTKAVSEGSANTWLGVLPLVMVLLVEVGDIA